MPARVTGRGRDRMGSASTATDTAFLTVMLDVTANLLCTAVILLVLSLATDRRGKEVTSQDVAAVTTPILKPAELVAAFRLRTTAVAESVTIDVDGAGVTVKRAGSPPAMAERLSRSDVLAGKLAPLLAESRGASALLFIFDQAGYNSVRAAIDEVGVASREIDVPLALRSAADPQGWSQGFRSLFGLDLDAQAFQHRLQQILVGRGGAESAATDGRPTSVSDGMGDVIDRLLRSAGFLLRLMLVGAALIFMIWIRRRPWGAWRNDGAE